MVTEKYEILTTSRFYLELTLEGSQDLIDGYFQQCTGFKRRQEVVEICEVTPQMWGSKGAKCGRVMRTKLPGNSRSENLILKFGMTISTTMWKWFEAVEQGNWGAQCRDGDLTLYDQGGVERARFRFQGAWPVSYTIADANASEGDFQIEELELAINEFTRIK